MRTLTRSALVLLLSSHAHSFLVEERASFIPPPSRVVQIQFFVDSPATLDRPFLELTLPKDRFRRHVVAMAGTAEGPARGIFEGLVPEGNLDLVVCGLVACPRRETEIFCANVTVPEKIAVDQTHDVTFSTRYACQDSPAPLIAQSH